MGVTNKQLESQRLIRVEVVAHQPWGVEVRVLPPDPSQLGTVDVMHVTDERPYNPPADFPEIGRQLEAVVLGYTPSGQLRLSLQDSDIDLARGESS